MGLKQDIVIVNEYTVKGLDGKGSRGSTPGDYATRYMARNGAVEDLTPVFKRDTDTYIMRYMARNDATESIYDKSELVYELNTMDGLSGVAFSKDSVSLSEKKLKEVSKDIQQQFDEGKTVLKTVISFEGDYLKKHNILPPEFNFKQSGDFRGKIDQMKLRMAIQNGLSKMESDYDDLIYVGVIQVDTAHVHCHLAMVDRGVGNVVDGAEQRGKLLEKNKAWLRRGIDSYLDDHGKVAYLSNNVSYDRRNVKSFIKKFAHDNIYNHGQLQFIISTLPSDKTLWRASTNNKLMKKSNELVNEFVMKILDENDLYEPSLKTIREYADYRLENEGLTQKEYKKLIDNGKKRLINECSNAIYEIIKQIDDKDLNINTPTLDLMSMDLDFLIDQRKDVSDDFYEFTYRLRTYSSRLNHHKSEKNKYKEARKEFEKLDTEDISDDAIAIYNLLKFEELYNDMCMAKYQYFINVIPKDDIYIDKFEEIKNYDRSLNNLTQMINDPLMSMLKPDAADRLGLEKYKQTGGRYKVINPDILNGRLERLKDKRNEAIEDFKSFLSDYSLSYDEDTREILKKSRYEFDDVKALDLHHLQFDFLEDIPVSKINVDNFIAVSDLRNKLLDEVGSYLSSTGQTDQISFYNVSDIRNMQKLSDQLRVNPMIKTGVLDGSGRRRKTLTIPIDQTYNELASKAVTNVVNNYSLDNLSNNYLDV